MEKERASLQPSSHMKQTMDNFRSNCVTLICLTSMYGYLKSFYFTRWVTSFELVENLCVVPPPSKHTLGRGRRSSLNPAPSDWLT